MRQSDDRWALLARDVQLLGVSLACRRHGIHRSTWYRLAGKSPSDPKPAPRSELLRGPVRDLALDHPSWGCDRIAYFLSFSGIEVSSPTIQKILKAEGLGRRADREAAREAREKGDTPGFD